MIIRFPLERASPDLKSPKGSYNYLKALQKALGEGKDTKQLWELLKK